jgi:hypothetical protein
LVLTLFNQYNQIIGKDDRTDLKYRKIKQTVQCRMAEYNKAAILQNIIKLKYSIMKKQLLKLTMLALTFFSVSLINAQEYEEYTQRGLYTIGAADGSGLLITIDSGAPGFLKWAAPIEGGSPTQQFAITDHPAPMSAGYVQITAEIPGLGAVRLGTNAENIELDANGAPTKNITVIMKQGAIVVDEEAADYGYDQFQRRKTGTSRGGNDALFIKVPGQGGSRYGVTAADGDPIKFDGGGIDKIEFKFISVLDADQDGIEDHLDKCPNEAGIEDLVQGTDEDGNPAVDADGNAVMVPSDVHGCPEGTASVNTFGVDAFVITNPVSNQLTIKGATSKVSRLNVYSVLGNAVLSKVIDNQNGDISVNVSALSSGLYIVELNGENGERLTKKIIKQ